MNNFISLDKNDMLSALSKEDLKDVIDIIDNFYLVYRDTLNLDKTVSFGPEIEYEYIKSRVLVDNFIKDNFNKWISKDDYSLNAQNFSGEISSPILHDDKNTWHVLQKICEYLKELKANTSLNASCHIHSGAHILGNNTGNWIKYLKLYLVYEHIYFRFAYGDKINGRAMVLSHAKNVRDKIYSAIKRFNMINKDDIFFIGLNLPKEKKYAINFKNTSFKNILDDKGKNTVEYRTYNGTVEEIIIQNYINLSTKMMLAPSKNLIDEEYLDYKIEKLQDCNNKLVYDNNEYYKICLNDALEFVDMVFDNNLDKVYFLRQYLKDYQEKFYAFSDEETTKSKIFIYK